ncbi:hypothetical protein HKX48_004469 [Thoreauomyces humboldtii]|nr:hypothetical protein HKX48_004469 [Thoreauomyces humboldtii]
MATPVSQKDKTCLITGSSKGGIGHALALRFQKAGFRVFATARRLEAMDDLRAAGIETFVLDVTSDESVAAAVKHVEEVSGSLSVLVNNAGMPFPFPALDIPLDEVRRMFETNLFGVMRMNSAFQHLLVAGKGTIVHIGSVAGYMPFLLGAAYNASKAALHSYANTLRYEVAPFGIQVMTVVTGAVSSNITSQAIYRSERPAHSLYARVLDTIVERKKGSIDSGMAIHTYADVVVRKVTGRGRWYQLWSRVTRPAMIWAGGKVNSVWLFSFLPVEVFSFVQDRIFGFSQLVGDDFRKNGGAIKGAKSE